MKIIIVAAASALAAGSANAQAVVDGSDAKLEPSVVKAAISAASKTLKDPLSAQFKSLRLIHTSKERPDVICGYVNAKNGFGGYVGFRPFYYEAKRNLGGVVQDTSDKMQRLPLEWTGCAKELGE